MGSIPCTGARDQYSAVAGAGGSSECGRRGVVRTRGGIFGGYLPSLADGEEARRLMEEVMDSAGTAVELWRKEEGFRDAEMRGVPGSVGVLVGVEPAVEVFTAEPAVVDCPPTLNVDVEAVAWWVGCMYGEWVLPVVLPGCSASERESS